MKKTATALLLLPLCTGAWAQQLTCHIEGTTTDTATTKIFVEEEGNDIRTMTDVVAIPVTDGKFSYDLKTDRPRYFHLMADNQYYNGRLRMANFVAEEQKLKVTMGTFDDKVKVEGTGRETVMMQRCNREMDERFDPQFEAINAKIDSIENILKKEIEGMTQEQKKAYAEDLLADDSKNPHAAEYKRLMTRNEQLFMEYKTATIDWLDKNPCLYGLAMMMKDFSSRRARQAPFTAHEINSYKTTYARRYEGHPYHERIATEIKSLDLTPGNRYIDFDVRGTDGRNVKLSSLFTGKVIYIDMWASWCVSCRRHAKELIPLYEKYKDKGFQVIAIARERKEADMLKAIENDGYKWTCLLELNDGNQVWLKNGLNASGGGGFLIDADGTILAVYPEADETERILKEKLIIQN